MATYMSKSAKVFMVCPKLARLPTMYWSPTLSNTGTYNPNEFPGLFDHTTRPISFCLIVDNFGVKYVGEEHAMHLRDVLQAKYPIIEDWTGETFCGLHLDWDYTNGTVNLSMPHYVAKALQRFQHPPQPS